MVSNSLKHAFPDDRDGEIRIDLHPDDGRFALVVSDDGVGFPPGLDFRATRSLGLQLVLSLVDQLEGAIELNGCGATAFKITFGELSSPMRRGNVHS